MVHHVWTLSNSVLSRSGVSLGETYPNPIIVAPEWSKHTNKRTVRNFLFFLFYIIEWVSDCHLTPSEPFFSYVIVRTSYLWDNDDGVHLVLYQQAELDFYSVSSHKAKLCEQTCHSTWTHYPDSEPTSLCSYSLMLCA
jgi:hypothetical protein